MFSTSSSTRMRRSRSVVSRQTSSTLMASRTATTSSKRWSSSLLRAVCVVWSASASRSALIWRPEFILLLSEELSGDLVGVEELQQLPAPFYEISEPRRRPPCRCGGGGGHRLASREVSQVRPDRFLEVFVGCEQPEAKNCRPLQTSRRPGRLSASLSTMPAAVEAATFAVVGHRRYPSAQATADMTREHMAASPLQSGNMGTMRSPIRFFGDDRLVPSGEPLSVEIGRASCRERV